MNNQKFPPGWNQERVRRVLAHYESQTAAEAATEDEAAFKRKGQTMIEVPSELMPVIRELLSQHQRRPKSKTTTHARNTTRSRKTSVTRAVK